MIIDNYFLYVWYDRDKETMHPLGTTEVSIYSLQDFENNGRKVKTLVDNATPISKGVSVCSPKDKFVKRIGFLQAANRAITEADPSKKVVWNRKSHTYEVVDRPHSS